MSWNDGGAFGDEGELFAGAERDCLRAAAEAQLGGDGGAEVDAEDVAGVACGAGDGDGPDPAGAEEPKTLVGEPATAAEGGGGEATIGALLKLRAGEGDLARAAEGAGSDES
jgi:hypothetical protein